jgi:alpha-mannosidase
MGKRKHTKIKNTIYLVPHTHYDVVWAFNKEDYFLIFTSILRKAIEMIADGDFKFLIEQTYPLEMLEHRNPELFAEIEKAVQEGSIEIVDGQYLMPDYMIPGGEVLVRGILYGKRYCKEKFGVDVPVAWAADGFGLNAQLPQIYRKSGYRWLAFRRGLPRSIGSRVSEFIWKGLDGSRIVSHWMPLGYRAGLWLDHWEESYRSLAKLATTPHILMPCGSGGSMPQEDIPEKIRRWNAEHEDAPVVMATPGEFFESFEREESKLITFKGELYSDELESIFPDVASSRVRLRLAIRDRESELIMTEKAAALALLSGKPYPGDDLDEAWRKKLFLVMHDVVPGCGIDEIYDEAWEYIEDIRESMPGLLRASVKHLMKGRERGKYLIVFNPNNWKAENWVEADVELAEGWKEEPRIAIDGREIPSDALEIVRWDDGSISRARIGFMASVPPLGCRAYGLTKKSKNFRSRIKVEENNVQNKFFKLSINAKTGILTVFDHEDNLLLTGNEIVIDEELGDLYFHRSFLDTHIGTEGGEGLRFGVFKPEPIEVEKGAVRTVVTFKNSYYCLRWPYYLTEKYDPLLFRHKTVEITKRIIIYKDIPRIDFETKLNLLQPHVQISVKFDTGMVAPRYTRQTQFGALEQHWRRSLCESMKIPSLSWITAQEDGRGIAFLTLGVPINEIRGGEIYCTLLRSVSVLSSDGKSGPLIPTPEARELGENSYRYSIYPYAGDWRDVGVHRFGFEMNQPLRAVQVDWVPERLECGSFMLEPHNLILSALKKAEDGDALIFRFFETCGERCRARIGVPDSITGASVVNLMEEDVLPLDVEEGIIEIDVKPFEIVSLKLIYR